MPPQHQFSPSRDFHLVGFRCTPGPNDRGDDAAGEDEGNRGKRIVGRARQRMRDVLQQHLRADQRQEQRKRQLQVIEPMKNARQGEVQRTQTNRAMILLVNTRNGSPVMAKIAGIESIAKIKIGRLDQDQRQGERRESQFAVDPDGQLLSGETVSDGKQPSR